MLLWNTSETVTDLTETQVVAVEVQADLQQLKPNVMLETIKGWTPGLLAFTYRLLIAILIILVGMKLASWLRKFLKRTFTRLDMDLSLSKFLISLINAAVYLIFLFMALEKVGVPSASIIALLGSATLAIGLSLQGSLANFAGGILILLMRPFMVGDYIISQGMEGTVHSIGLVYTKLITGDNKVITVPNGSLSNAAVTNVTAREKRRVDLRIGISYTSDLKKAKEILLQLYSRHSLVIPEDGISVFVDELGASAVWLGARGWVKTGDYWAARCDLTEAVKEAFDKAGIEIPFGQVDVHIKNELALRR